MNKKSFIKRMIYCPFLLFPIRKSKVVCSNFYGKGYGDNPKYIAEQLVKKGYVVYWLCDDVNKYQFPNYINAIKKNSFKALFHLATASVWIDNCRKPMWIIKRKEQRYYQTWHGSFGIKKAEGDALGKLEREYVESAINDSKMIDRLFADSEFGKKVWARSFWIEENKIDITGLARTDIFWLDTKSEIISKVKQSLGIEESQKIVLYAPTFRNNGDEQVIDSSHVISSFNHRLGGNWKFVFRLHPRSKGKIEYKDAINASGYEDMQELLLAADALITDYSGCSIDMVLQKKPVFMYAEDIDSYVKERGLALSTDELPYEVARNQNELNNIILNYDREHYEMECEKFLKEKGFKESGDSSKIIAEIISKDVSFMLGGIR